MRPDYAEGSDMHRFRAGAAVSGAFLALFMLAGLSSAASPVDMRGSWACVTSSGSSKYPQTVTITSEDFTTGRIAGKDFGGGLTFQVTGTVTGNSFTMAIASSTYKSNVKGTITGVLPHLAFTSSFADSNHATGSFTGKMTAAAVPPVSSAPAVSAGPVETPAPAGVAADAPVASDAAIGPVATTDPGAAGPITPPETPPGDSNPLPTLLELALAAAVLAGLGAAALGLVPGVPGIVGSFGDSGSSGHLEAQTPAQIAGDPQLQCSPSVYMQAGVALPSQHSPPQNAVGQAVTAQQQAAQTVVGTNLQNAVGQAVTTQQQAARAAQAAAVNPTLGETPTP
jgi:hypothetical protein